MIHRDSCKYCMCLKCPRLSIDKHTLGHCDSCNNCRQINPLIDLRKGEYCVWREEYEKSSSSR